MKAFDYRAPTSLDEAVRILADKGDRARPLAGGTDLLVQLRVGRFDLDVLVDVKRIPELIQIRFRPDQPNAGLAIGAAVPCCQIYEDTRIQAHYPAIIDSASIVGGIGIQGRATLGGNLCNSSPSGDTIPALICLGATAQIAGPNGSRTVPVADFCAAPGRSVLQKGEILVAIHLPLPKPHSGARYLRFIPRNEMDIAVVGVGASIVLAPDAATITEARIALGAVGPTPIFAREAGEILVGRAPTEESFALAALAAQAAARPITDVRGTTAQRRHLIGVFTKRALRGALERALAR